MAPTRYYRRITRLLEKEKLVRPLPRSGDLSVCLAYPNSYSIGMASLGFQVVRRIFSESGCIVERAFLPKAIEARELLASGELLPAWESMRPARDFDLLAFSIPFELDFPNVVRMLLLAGIPVPAAERHQGHPLVIAGGAAVSINSQPIADFLDVVVLGESEQVLPRLISMIRELKGHRAALLERLAEEQGVFVPSIHDDSETRHTKPPDLQADDIAIADIVAADAEFGEAVLIEVGRGCSMGCRFCWAGWACRPVRSHDVDQMLDAVDRIPQELDRFGLIATSHFDHPHFFELVRGLRSRGKRITVSALRVDRVNEELLAALVESGSKSIAIAPETGSNKLRRSIGKRFSNEQVVSAAGKIAASGLRNLKLYFLLGLPGEEGRDIDSIADLTKKIVEAVGDKIRVSLSVNFFVPKPGTPFADIPLLAEAELRRRMRKLKRSISRIPDVELSAMAPWQAVLQTLLSRGGREVGELLYRGVKEAWSLRQLHQSVPREWLEKIVYLRKES